MLFSFSAVMAGRSFQPGRESSLYVNVEQKDGLVQGLAAGNFRLYEDGHSRRFRLMQPETPVTMALLVEYSQSSWLFLNDIQSAITGFLDAAPEGNWYALATFSQGLTVQVDFTKLTGKIRTAYEDLGQPLWSEVDTYDAVYEMLDRMEQLPGRKVLVVIGSGFDTFSRHTLSDVQKKLEESDDVVVYVAGLGSLLRGEYDAYLTDSQRMDLFQSQSFLRMLAEKSGGQAWFPRFDTAFLDVMTGMIQDVQNQYRLVYVPEGTGDKLHKIKVEAFRILDDKRHDYKVRVRDGWRP